MKKKSRISNFGIKNRYFLIITIVIFLIEIIIAKFFPGTIIRHVFGDFFVVILIYSFFRAFTLFSKTKIAWGTLIFSYIVELSQWVNLLQLLGIKKSKATDIIIGSTFDWRDILAYTFGVIFVITLDKLVSKQKKKRN